MYDTGCRAPIYNTKHDLRGERKLKQGAVYFNKRAKLNLDSTYMWHCRLAHISKKHIEKLQHDGLLKSTDDESFYQCVSCLSSKMTRKPFTHRTERAIDLLRLIHMDVCGLLRHVSRQDTLPSENTSKILDGVEGFEPPQEDDAPVHSPKPSAKEHLTKDDVCYHSKEVGHWKRNRHVYLVELMKKKKHIGSASTSGERKLKQGAVYFNKRAKLNLDSTYMWHCRLAHISKKHIEKLQHDGLLKSTDDESFYQCVSCLSSKMTRKPFTHRTERAIDLLRLIHMDVCGLLRHVSRQDTLPSENTSKILDGVEGFEPPQEDDAPVHSLGDLNKPTNYKSALLDLESNKWLDVINLEMQSMKNNQVWRLVDFPPNGKNVRSKWLFKKNTDMDGNVYTYKTRLVAKGYTQTYGIDYEKTLSPVADIRAIRILIAISAFCDYAIWKMNVKSALLNGYLDEDIYMVQPKGFIDPKHPRKVCKLQRSILDLKQASRSWNKRSDGKTKNFSFAQNLDEPCVYQKAREASFILEIKIYQDRSKRLVGLSQIVYMDKILKRFKMDNSKCGNIPMEERLDLNKTQGASTPEEVKFMKNVPYASGVGSIMYAVRCTRLDVAFAQNITSRFQQNPVDWKSFKQSTTTMFTTEAKYVAVSEAAMEAVWIRKFISGLGIVPTITKPIKMICDISAALLIANEPRV
nr:hypothetical protein [Tanacetum cinerariifolium]